LPNRSVLDILSDIRKINLDTEIILIAENSSFDDASKAIRESIHDFLKKPVNINYFKKTVRIAENKVFV